MSKKLGINKVALAGGVSANSGLRTAIREEASRQRWQVYIPSIGYTTDNAAMIAITGHYKFLKGEFASDDIVPLARMYF